MKKIFSLIILVFSCFLAVGQLSVIVPTVTAVTGQTVYIPVRLVGASSSGIPISSANIQITYDTAVLTYVALTNFYSGTPQSQWYYSGSNGIVAANWLEPSLNTLAIPDSTSLYSIQFHFKGGSSPLIFIVYEFTDINYNLITTTPVNGAVNGAPHQITFHVDMSRENVSINGVHLAGSFNNWNYSQTLMTPLANNIYEATLTLAEGTTYQYRYVNGVTASGLETVPANCGVPDTLGQYNRQFEVPHHDTAYDTVCFSMCGHCPADIMVKVRVDMQHVTVSSNGVHVAGTFNNWNYSQTPMFLSGGTIYEDSMVMEEGTYVEYLFVNGNSSLDAETIPPACAVSGHRYFTVPDHDTVLSAFCYDSCLACGVSLHYSHVTFRVDMITQNISPNGVHIAGTFQGWDPGLTPMTYAFDSVFSYTDTLLSSTSVQYRFVNGNDSSGLEIVPFPCEINGNRSVLVPDHDTILNIVCFAECDSCLLDGTEILPRIYNSLAQNFPNPCSETTTFGYTTDQDGYVKLVVYNMTGQPVSVLYDGQCTAGSYHIPFNAKELPKGLYYFQILFTGKGEIFTQSKKMIVQ